jgi:hypothetical protein
MGIIQNSGQGPRRITDTDRTSDTTRAARRTNTGAASEIEATRAEDAAHAAVTRTPATGDRIEVSAEARMLLAKSETPGYVVHEPTQEQLAKLRRGYLDGSLTTAELLEYTAKKLLGG